ncbi:endo alpha-1,4 polygalactosaminidase [Kribbella sp. CA-293567]|uniref:endo alpha-1,4 polygalactosaminidase n=1 Tax=Kribbella sp. CA-293567 TaxID=3002436 RepID=UPI0022DE7464|nr:endo alpha-1,4 polygalactosaminidase [Kribbella sp. CA-293567]WBQ03942.1 endo alpha-1,4 polygalactosaminidase [Kribbella sp. CA-293567]
MSRFRIRHLVAVATAAALATATLAALSTDNAASAATTLPPTHAKFDYQIGGAYTPPAGVQVVTRDRTVAPAAGLYNICYVNAFQVQPGEQSQWPSDLLLRDAQGNLVIDEDWGEALLDIRGAKAARVAAKVNGWIDGCAAKGYKAIEPDNYDSYLRSRNLISTSQARAYLKLLADHSHSRNLAIAQKNTVELSQYRASIGLDFAVAEECGQYDECGDYVAAFGNNVIVIEYTNSGRQKACSGFGSRLSIVQRDVDVSTPGTSGYVRKTC